MKLVWKIILSLIVLLLVIWFFGSSVFAQSKIDTTLWKQCEVKKINVVMVPVGRSWKVTLTHGNEIAYQYCNRYPSDLKEHDCIVIGKDIWEQLLKNK